MFDTKRKSRAKSFLHWKDCLSLQKIVLSNLLGPKGLIIYFQSICRITMWTLIKCSLRFVILDNTRKKGQNLFFSLERLPFFKALCFQQPLGFLRIWPYYFRSKIRVPRGHLQSVFLRFVILDNSIMREKGQDLFFTRRIAFFSKIYVFKKPLRCYRSDLMTSTVIVRIPCGPLQSVPWDLSYSIIREKGQNLFFTGKIAFFSKLCVFKQPLRCYRNDHITSTLILGLLFGPLSIMFWGLSHSIKREKNRPKVCQLAESIFWKVWFSNS